MTEYVAKLKPVLLGPKVLKGMWKAPHSWSKARLISAWGDMPTVDSIDQSKSREAKRAREWFPMSRFVKEHIDEAKNSGVPSDTTQPPYFLELSGNVLKFMQDIGEIGVFNYSTLEIASFLWFLGPAFSGAPNHYHGHALNILVYGAKRWFLTPPPHARYDLKSGWECTDRTTRLLRARSRYMSACSTRRRCCMSRTRGAMSSSTRAQA